MDITDKIADALQMVSDEANGYYNTGMGEIVWILDFDDDSEEILEEIENNFEKYINLPTKRDINEYSMMSKFADKYADTQIGAILIKCLCGRGAFRRFKDKIYYLGIEKEWFAYRNGEYKRIAENWCEKNKLKFSSTIVVPCDYKLTNP